MGAISNRASSGLRMGAARDFDRLVFEGGSSMTAIGIYVGAHRTGKRVILDKFND